MNDYHYAFPEGAYLLIGSLILIIISISLYSHRNKQLEAFANHDVLKNILIARSKTHFFAKSIALCLGWILITFAIMQPIGNGYYPFKGEQEPPNSKEILIQKRHDVIFLLDASLSMSVKDTRTKTSRFEFAKEIVDEIISKLKGENSALYAFTSEATKLAPLTLDYLFVRLNLKNMSLNEGDVSGTDLLEALKKIQDSYFKNLTPIYKTLIILTDSGDNQLETLSNKEKDRRIHEMLNLLRHPEENRLHVYTIGLGTPSGEAIPNLEYEGKPVISTLDETLLKRLSRTGGGKYYFANEWSAENLSADLVSDMRRESSSIEKYKFKRKELIAKGQQSLVYDLFFQIPLGFGIFLISFVAFFPDTHEKKTFLIVPAVLFCMIAAKQPVFADNEIFLTRQAENYFEAKNYEEALEIFYKLQKEHLHHWQQERLLYNIGTAYLELGNLEKALETYEIIELSKGKPHILKRPLKTNQAILHFRQALLILNQQDISLQDYEKAVFLIKDCLKKIAQAEKAECRFDLFIGKTACDDTPDLKKLKEEALNKLAKILEKHPEAEAPKNLLAQFQKLEFPTQKMEAPEQILEEAIKFQSHSLTLQRMKHDMEKGNDLINKTLNDLQSKAILLASEFIPSILSKEKKEFPLKCQCKPWDEVVPLFDKGYFAALNAKEFIETHKPMSSIIKNQEKALTFWKEAFEKLKNPKTPPETKTDTPPSLSPETHPLDNILKELQQMDLEDKTPKSQNTPSKQGVRSW